MKNILIVGATSAIAEAVARVAAKRGDKLFLIARNEVRLPSMVDDLKIRGASSVDYALLDINHIDLHGKAIDLAFESLGKIEIVLIAHGTLPDQKNCEKKVEVALAALKTNAVGTVSILTHIANKLEAQGDGILAVITSVAGDRGRKSNYVYGASKRMVSTFLQGLRGRLHKRGVWVLDIKPGFVDTPMTRECKKGLLWVKPEKIAVGIIRAIDKEKGVIYLPWFWRYIMLVIKCLPERICNRLDI